MKFLAKTFVLLTIALSMVIFTDDPARAEWMLETDSPTILHDYTLRGNFNPAVYAGNRDCKPYNTILYGGSPYSCRIKTKFGTFVDFDLARSGTYMAGEVNNINGNPLALPGSTDLLSVMGSKYSGYRLYMYRDVADNMTTQGYPNNVRHRVHKPAEPLLTDTSSGTTNKISRYSVSFSSNSRWLLAQVHGGDLVRIDLESGKAYYFGEAIHGMFGNNEPKTAISDNGRYAAIGSGRFGSSRLYDLAQCAPTADEHHDCPYIDLRELLENSKYPEITGMQNVRFRNDTSVYIKFTYKKGGSAYDGNVLVNAPGYSPSDYAYLALGDSFASGEGAFSYKPVTDSSKNGCRVSTVSYPFRLGAALGLSNYDSVACSGAVINDVYFPAVEDYESRVDEIIQKDRSEFVFNNLVEGFIPGYLNQNTFIQEYRPEHITVSAIGNDIGFDDIIMRCLGQNTCYNSREDRMELIDEINRQIPRMADMFNGLLATGHEDTQLYAVGYPHIVKAVGNCGNNVRLDRNETVFAEQLISYLNEAVEVAARQAGVVYVDVEDAFYGHRLCEDTSSPAVHGLTGGFDAPELLNGPFGKQSYHPTSFGHLLLAARISDQTNQFNMPAPVPDSDAWIGDTDTPQLLYNSSPVDRVIRTTHYDDSLSVDLVQRSHPLNITADSDDDYTLRPNHMYKAWLFSEPTLLGEATTDDDGTLNANFAIPAHIPDGYHTIKILGTNIVGKPIALHKTIFVSDMDYDTYLDRQYGEECLNQTGFLVACLNSLPGNTDNRKADLDQLANDGQVSDSGPIGELGRARSDTDYSKVFTAATNASRLMSGAKVSPPHEEPTDIETRSGVAGAVTKPNNYSIVLLMALLMSLFVGAIKVFTPWWDKPD